MNKSPPLRISPHRRAQLVRWALAMLSWVALVLFRDAFANRRRIRRRYRFVSLFWLKKLLCSLALVRAAEIAKLPKPPQRALRNSAPAGFHRRIRRAGMMRAILGSRLRKALRARTPREQIEVLLAAFADLDGFARRYLVPRARKRLTKLHAIIVCAPPDEALASIAAACAPACADTS